MPIGDVALDKYDDLIDRFEQAVNANGYRTQDSYTDQEYREAKKALEDALREKETKE